MVKDSTNGYKSASGILFLQKLKSEGRGIRDNAAILPTYLEIWKVQIQGSVLPS
ncbi:hypothetical protein C5167_031902 [Papaver somniferum]|uniref:Uncharacterized protein n=1 Tax=Papaver somniferum TaxID=3469 RepID=A0A4Y7K8Q9_PAPSO|nr:hypothetical protein C5167_031902 [Papaver somniferum]